jgi:hypothetical protein
MSLELTIYRGTSEIVTFKPSGTSNQQKKIMGDNVINLSFELNQIINFNIGDYTIVFGEKYFLAKEPSVTKKGTYDYTYDMQMLSTQYQLSKAQYMFYDEHNELREGDFSITGVANVFIDLLIKNANRLNPGWTKGAVVSTDTKTLTFSKKDCGAALAQIANEFGAEFFVDGMKVHLDKNQHFTPYSFRYGDSKGLYTITRKQTDNTSVITRLYAFGSEKNLPPGYPSTRLRLPGGYDYVINNLTWTITDNITNPALLFDVTLSWTDPTSLDVNNLFIQNRIVGNHDFVGGTEVAIGLQTATLTLNKNFQYEILIQSRNDTDAVLSSLTVFKVDKDTPQPTPIFIGGTALPYLEENADLYGVIEDNYINDDILPHRTGKVTAADATDIYKFTDSLIDFDVNTQVLPGLTAKVTFNSGDLIGYTFDISAFDNGTKQFTILKNKDEKALEIPSSILRPRIGDEYVLTDIEMPASYVKAAEQLLQVKAQEYLDLYSKPLYSYIIVCDPKWFRANKIKMNIGDVVFLNDLELMIEKYIRVISLTKSLIDEYEYQLELGDVVPTGTLQQIIQNQQSTQSGVDSVTGRFDNNALLEGYFIGPVAADVSAMKALYVDDAGKIWKAP